MRAQCFEIAFGGGSIISGEYDQCVVGNSAVVKCRQDFAYRAVGLH